MKRTAVHSLMCGVAGAAMVLAGVSLRAEEGEAATVTKTHVHTQDLEGDAVNVELHEGVATLTGTVIHETDKALAQQAVSRLPGVVRVDSQLTTRSELIARKAKASRGPAPLARPSTRSAKTPAETRDRDITLTGLAGNTAAPSLITRLLTYVHAATRGRNAAKTGSDATQ